MFKKWICQNRNWVFQNFPFLENDFDALTDYELFCKMVEYAKSLAISNDKFVSDLKSNLDTMYNEGKFDSFIEEIINLQTTFTFDSVADMKSATNLIDGCYARTSGFYSYNDGGGAFYKIRQLTNIDIINDKTIVSLYDNNLIAELISFNIRPEMVGAYGDGIHNDSDSLQCCFDNFNNIEFGNNKTYLLETPLIISNEYYKVNGNNSKLYADFTQENPIINGVNMEEGLFENIQFEGGINTGGILVKISDSGNVKVNNCKFYNLGLYGVSYAQHVSNSYFYNCACKTGNNNGNGMIYAGKDNVIYENNEFYALGGDALDHCIYAGGSHHENIMILNNKCIALEGCSQGPLLALYPSEENIEIHDNCIVKGNLFDYRNGLNGRASIVLQVKNTIFENNISYGVSTSTPSIWLYEVENSNISNNIFNSGYLKFTHVKDTKFDNNQLNDCSNLSLDGTTNSSLDNLTISNNKFNQTPIIQGEYASNIEIIGNIFNNINGSAINMNKSSYASSNVKIINNIIKNASEYGIICRYITQVMIIGNTIIDTENYEISRGIDVQYDGNYANSIIANNNVIGTTLEGYSSLILAQRTGAIVNNNYGKELSNGMLTAYPENQVGDLIENHTPYYIGELLNLNGVIYVAKGVSGASDWVQISN